MEKLKNWIEKFISNRIPEQTPEWRPRGDTLFFILFIILIFSIISAIPTLITSFIEKEFVLFSTIFGSYLGVLFLILKRKMNYYVRSYIICFLLLLVGFSTFYTGTLVSSGRLWFLSSAAIACLLINLRAGIFFFLLSLFSILGTSHLNDYEVIVSFESDKFIWTMTIFTFFVTNALIIGSICLIVSGRRKAEKEKKEAQEQLFQSQKLESIGKLVGGIAHDYNNILGVILGHTELMLLKIDENHPFYSNLKEIESAGRRSADVTKQLLAYARKQITSPKVLNLNETIDNMLKTLRYLIGENIDLLWEPSDKIWSIKMDPTQLDQILINLCINARDAVNGSGKITIETETKIVDKDYCSIYPDFKQGEYVKLSVSDNGSGMTDEVKNSLFEPFFTTKKEGKGTGLGLSTVYGIVKQNEGFINVYSEVGYGTTFNIYLPRFTNGEKKVKEVKNRKTIDTSNTRILVVEDDPKLLELTNRALKTLGYNVVSTSSSNEALNIIKNRYNYIDLILTDVVMPEMNGAELMEKVENICPKIKCLFMSGYTSNVIAHQGVLDDGISFIQKPFNINSLSDKIQEVLNT